MHILGGSRAETDKNSFYSPQIRTLTAHSHCSSVNRHGASMIFRHALAILLIMGSAVAQSDAPSGVPTPMKMGMGSMSMGMGGGKDKGGKEEESDAPSGVPTESTSDAPSHVPTPMKMGMGMGGMGMGMTDKGGMEGKGTSENEFLVTSKRRDSNRFAIWALNRDIQMRRKEEMERQMRKSRRVKVKRARIREAEDQLTPKTRNQRTPKTRNQRNPRAPKHQKEWYDDSYCRNR
jgi:hypothetical protein